MNRKRGVSSDLLGVLGLHPVEVPQQTHREAYGPLQVTVAARAVPKARARVVRGRAFTPTRTRDFERMMRAEMAARATAERWVPRKDVEYELRIAVITKDRRRGDVDNFAKAVMDAGNGVLWPDDSQISLLSVKRYKGEKEDQVCVAVWVR